MKNRKKLNKLAIRIANAYGYKKLTSTEKYELVDLNLQRWKERSYRIEYSHLYERFWISVNKYERLLYGHPI